MSYSGGYVVSTTGDYRINREDIQLTMEDIVRLSFIGGNSSFLLVPSRKEPFDYEPRNIVYSGKCTVVFWKDGSKTIVKAADDEVFDKEVGFAMALAKKVLGSRSKFLKIVESGMDQVKQEKKKKLSIIDGEDKDLEK